jgi:hypothetical protein
LIVAATFGCVLDYLDVLPRLLFFLFPARLSAGVATPLWLFLAAAWWGLLGAGSAIPLVGLCRVCGLKRLAGLLGS